MFKWFKICNKPPVGEKKPEPFSYKEIFKKVSLKRFSVTIYLKSGNTFCISEEDIITKDKIGLPLKAGLSRIFSGTLEAALHFYGLSQPETYIVKDYHSIRLAEMRKFEAFRKEKSLVYMINNIKYIHNADEISRIEIVEESPKEVEINEWIRE